MKIKILYTEKTPVPDFDNRTEPDQDSKYELIWEGLAGEININAVDDIDILEEIFDSLNKNPLKGSQGNVRSLSIGDIVAIEDRYYICDTNGWHQIDEPVYNM